MRTPGITVMSIAGVGIFTGGMDPRMVDLGILITFGKLDCAAWVFHLP